MPNKKYGKSSADYYKENPASYKKKLAKDKEINAKPEQREKRIELIRKNREADKRGVNRQGKDYDHAVGRYVPSSTNRGRTNGTKGDNRARGKSKK